MRLVEINNVSCSGSRRWINPDKVLWVQQYGTHKDECIIAMQQDVRLHDGQVSQIEMHVLNDPQTVVNLLLAG